jgi:hypothetical protein
VFKQLQVHSFYMIYALYTSYKHWPVVFDRFASCLDHFPAYFALFLPRMRSPQTSEKKVFFGHEKKPFDLQQKMLSLQLATHLLYRQDGIILPLLPLSKNAGWLKCYQHCCVYRVRNPDTERRKTGKRSDTPRGRSTREQERGEVREPQRLDLSQGTMI